MNRLLILICHSCFSFQVGHGAVTSLLVNGRLCIDRWSCYRQDMYLSFVGTPLQSLSLRQGRFDRSVDRVTGQNFTFHALIQSSARNMDDSKALENYDLVKALEIPAHVSCLAYGHAGHLYVGSGEHHSSFIHLTLQSIATEDGSLRVYDLSLYKVIKAIRSLGAEVSSVVCLKRPGSELRDVWLACGSRASRFFPYSNLSSSDILIYR